MTHGERWLACSLAGAALLLGSGAHAAQAPAAGGAPAGGGAARPGTAAPVFTPPPPIRPGAPISVLVFPFSYAGEPAMAPAGAPAGTPDPVAQIRQDTAASVTAAVKAGFLSTPAYSVITYHPTQSSLIQRARRDEILTAADVAGVTAADTGAVDPAKARNLAYKLGLQSVLIGTFDMTTDPMANTVEITTNAELIDSTTGQRLRTAAVSGAAQGAEGVPPVVVRERAAQEAAQKLFPAMGIELVTPPPPPPPAEKSRSRSRRSPRRAPAKKDDSAREQEKAQREARASEEAARKAEDKARREAQATAREGEERAREEARKAAEAAAKAEREQARAAEKARRDAERQAARQSKAAPRPAPASQVASAQPAPAQPTPAQPATVQPEAAAAQPAAAPNTVKGVADPSGNPVPYGYAVDARKDIPERDRRNLRVPAWLGVAAFLAGISFLL
jgi:hypothetical protein